MKDSYSKSSCSRSKVLQAERAGAKLHSDKAIIAHSKKNELSAPTSKAIIRESKR